MAKARSATREDVVRAVADLQAERDHLSQLLADVASGSRLVHPQGHVAVIVPGDVLAAVDAAVARAGT